jgi:hypothetical protein
MIGRLLIADSLLIGDCRLAIAVNQREANQQSIINNHQRIKDREIDNHDFASEVLAV